MQELNARVDVDGETPKDAARTYLKEFGYIR
jgi:glycine betaine/choline ABC-type transport system substrate-binding protein